MKIALYCYEGSGLGHLTRLARLGSHLKENGAEEVRLFSAHRATDLITQEPLDLYRLPSRRPKGTEGGDLPGRTSLGRSTPPRKEQLRGNLEQAIQELDPEIFITDHRPRGLWGELDGILESNRSRPILLLRGILDEVGRATRELSAEFSHHLIHRYEEILICCDQRLIDVVEEYPFLRPHSHKIRYVGFIPPHFGASDVESIRQSKLVNGQDRWLVVSAGAGTYHSEHLPSVIEAISPFLDERWTVDVVFGPYSTTPVEPVRKLTRGGASFRFHRGVHRLSLWHFAADVVITPGGSNTIIEGLLGGAWVIPVAPEDPREIQLLSARLSGMGLCDSPAKPTETGHRLARAADGRKEARGKGLNAGGLQALTSMILGGRQLGSNGL